MKQTPKKIVIIVLALLSAAMITLCILMLFIGNGKLTNAKSKVSTEEINTIKQDAKNSIEDDESGAGASLRISVDEKIELTPKGVQESDSDSATKESDEEAGKEGSSDDYVIPDSSTRILADADVSKLSKEELALARNEIFARHGRIFKDPQFRDYFEGKSWYSGSIDPDDFDAKASSILSSTEKANIELIKKYEKK